MAYFNHAFCKSFVATDASASTGTSTADLTAGQLGIVDASTWATVNTGAAFDAPMYHLVQGSLHANDTIAGNKNHGGYAESVKSKGINPKYVSRIWGSSCEAAVASTVKVAVGPKCHPCGENLMLRLDVKGAPALRFLNRNAYAIGDSIGEGDVPGLCCVDGQEFLDPALALAKMGKMLLADPIVSPFVAEKSHGGIFGGVSVSNSTTAVAGVADAGIAVNAGGTGYAEGDLVTIGSTKTVIEVLTVSSGAVATVSVILAGRGNTTGTGTATVALTGSGTGFTVDITAVTDAGTYSIAEIIDGTYTPSTDPVTDAVSADLSFVGAYVDTKFGNCSFDTRDYYGKEPVQLVASMLDETGNPCNDCGTVTSTPGKMQQTSGETVIRQLLLTERYMQSPFNQGNKDSARIREIEGSEEVVTAIDRSALYKTYYVQHNVPRFNNASSVFDNDQYIYEIFVKCDDDDTNTEVKNILTRLATAANLGTPDYAIDDI